MTKPCDGCAARVVCCKQNLVEHPNQPYGVEVTTADGVFVKQMFIPDALTIVPQHSHAYDHLSLLATGAVRAWADGELIGDQMAPYPFHIKAGVKHTFQSLVPGTTIYCIHRLHGGKVEVKSEHNVLRSK